MSKIVPYNEVDGYIGFWLENKPYTPSELPYPDGNRNYIFKFLDRRYNNILRNKCNSNITDYFLEGEQEGDAYMNGRKFYDWKNIEIFKSHEEVVDFPEKENEEDDISICEELKQYRNVDIDINSLICTQFGHTRRSWGEIFELLERCNVNSDCYECTKIGHKIATSLIRIAALRIFASPEQSILELPVNSVDSYHPQSRIGKFGMGFFSFLYWLIGHPKRKLYIYSWFFDENIGYCGYCVTINDTPNGLSFNLRILETQVKVTGTFIYLDASEDEFENYNVANFGYQLDKLFYIENVRITKVLNSSPYSRDDTLFFKKLNQYNKADDSVSESIYILYGRNRITIEDYAQGIPINVLLGSLFVPSISTKKIESHARLDTLWNQKDIYSEPHFPNRFMILVGGVIVVSLEVPKNGHGLVIDMPPTTKLPVSRDDIVLDNITAGIFSESIKLALQYGFKEKNSARIERYLNKYLNYTANIFNKTIINDNLNIFYLAYEDSLVTKRFYEQTSRIFPQFVVSLHMNTMKIESGLIETNKYDTNIWIGKKVVIVDKYILGQVESFGMATMIFVSEKYTNTPNWEILAADSKQNLNLAPVGKGFAENLIEFYKLNLREEYHNDIFLGLYGIYDGLDIKFDNLDRTMLGRIIDDLHASHYTMEEMNNFAYAMINKFHSLNPNQTYGDDKKTIKFDLSRHYVWNDVSDMDIKLIGYRKDIILSYLNNFNQNNTNIIVDPYLVDGRNYCMHPDSFVLLFTPELCNLIAKLSSNVVEFFFTMVSFGIATKLTNDYENFKLFEYEPAIKSIIKNIRELGISHELYERMFNSYFAGNHIIEKYAYEIIEWHNMISNIIEIKPHIPTLKIENRKAEANTSKIIGYLFQNESDDFEEIITESSTYQGDMKFQMLEIAINEGTTKEFIPSVITELVQNSVDAIRMTNNPNKNITINFSSYQNDRFFLEVRDEVGIPPNGLLSLSIPFLSTKGDTELATGEMGSGFFNVYRESKLVSIDTIYNGRNYIFMDKPIRRNGRVVDVNRTFFVNDTDEPNRTIISIFTNKIDQAQIASYVGSARLTTVRIMSLCTLFNDISLSVNSQHIKLDKVHLFSYGYYDVFATVDQTIPSYILTNGIPYAPLINILNDDEYYIDVKTFISYGLIINIRHGGYTPVQTRTKISMPPEQWRKFQDILDFSIFALIVCSFNRSPHTIGSYYTQYNSKANVGQLENQNRPLKEDFRRAILWKTEIFNHMDLNMWKRSEMTVIEIEKSSINNTMLAYTNLLIKELGTEDNPNNPQVKQKLEDFVENLEILPLFPYLDKYTKQFLLGWIMSKNSNNPVDNSNVTVIEHPPDVDDEELEPYIRIWIETYSDMAYQYNITHWGVDNVNNIHVIKSSKKKNALGWFSPGNNNMYINTVRYTQFDRDNFKILINHIKEPSEFRFIRNKIWSMLFSYSFPASTCPHELEHARNKSGHRGAHANVGDALWEDDIPRERTFDDASNAVFERLLSFGFYPELYKRYKDAELISN
jgi:hypothetical protein